MAEDESKTQKLPKKLVFVSCFVVFLMVFGTGGNDSWAFLFCFFVLYYDFLGL